MAHGPRQANMAQYFAGPTGGWLLERPGRTVTMTHSC